MSNQHITAAIHCSRFKGIARQLLFILADAASSGPKDEKDKVLPFGYCKRKLQTLMAFTNHRRQQTVTDGIKELLDAGVIKRWLRKGESPLYFVDLEWLKARAYTEEELKQFEYPALKASGKRDAANVDASGTDDTQRQPANLGNAKQLTSKTESDGVDNANRLTVFQSNPPNGNNVPPTGFFPLNENENGSDTVGAGAVEKTPENPNALNTDSNSLPNMIAPPLPVHPAAKPQLSPVAPPPLKCIVETRLISHFYKLLGEDRCKLDKVAPDALSSLLRESNEEQLISLMTFALKESEFWTGVLFKAKDPMASFVKNAEKIMKDKLSEEKAAEVRAYLEAKRARKTELQTAPGAHGNVSSEGRIKW